MWLGKYKKREHLKKKSCILPSDNLKSNLEDQQGNLMNPVSSIEEND